MWRRSRRAIGGAAITAEKTGIAFAAVETYKMQLSYPGTPIIGRIMFGLNLGTSLLHETS
jgi:hypothetical protein